MKRTPAVAMRELRESRKEEGLVKVEVYIRPELKKRLASYVNHRLFGQCDTRPCRKSKPEDEHQQELSL